MPVTHKSDALQALPLSGSTAGSSEVGLGNNYDQPPAGGTKQDNVHQKQKPLDIVTLLLLDAVAAGRTTSVGSYPWICYEQNQDSLSHTLEDEEKYLSHLRRYFEYFSWSNFTWGTKNSLCICHAFLSGVPTFLRCTNKRVFRGCNEGFASQNILCVGESCTSRFRCYFIFFVISSHSSRCT